MKPSTLVVPVASILLFSLASACKGSDECDVPLRADKASIDAVVDEPLRIDTNLQTGFYEPLTYDGVPPGVVWNESDLSLEGTPTEVGTFTVTVHDAGNPKFDCPSTSTSFQIVVADKPIECASDNDCEILVNGGATCTESSDCNGSAFDRTCAKLDVGGGGIYTDVALEAAYTALGTETVTLKHTLLFADGDDAEQIAGCRPIVMGLSPIGTSRRPSGV